MIKGVNLGNWLVLEKWMSPSLFAGTEAEDETQLSGDLADVARRERLTGGWYLRLWAGGPPTTQSPSPPAPTPALPGYTSCITGAGMRQRPLRPAR